MRAIGTVLGNNSFWCLLLQFEDSCLKLKICCCQLISLLSQIGDSGTKNPHFSDQRILVKKRQLFFGLVLGRKVDDTGGWAMKEGSPCGEMSSEQQTEIRLSKSFEDGRPLVLGLADCGDWGGCGECRGFFRNVSVVLHLGEGAAKKSIKFSVGLWQLPLPVASQVLRVQESCSGPRLQGTSRKACGPRCGLNST